MISSSIQIAGRSSLENVGEGLGEELDEEELLSGRDLSLLKLKREVDRTLGEIATPSSTQVPRVSDVPVSPARFHPIRKISIGATKHPTKVS